MANLASLKAVVYGRVQGVFFRVFVNKHAVRLGLSGFVRNLPSGNEVEVRAEGDKERLEKLLEYLKTGPEAARVERVTADWEDYTGQYTRFKIRY